MIPTSEYNPYFKPYITSLSEEKSIQENLELVQQDFESTLRNIVSEKENYAYAEGKWTIKEVIQHLIDSERIFCYRALCFARNDKTDLPGFDQDMFVDNSTAQQRDYNELLDELELLRKGTIQLYKSFNQEDLLKIGTGSGNKISVRALGALIAGHQNHHLNVIKERYL
ncbi:DinB family protein [uncultured Tenacibaculum sp.]|uniref:DinB family protein n=1 Tax=uncultured Tenacibaculum sp. TaxID=174713 RepID=UPI002604780B|nr:DinB family protein [uncultured Tenacibaculum sp.]